MDLETDFTEARRNPRQPGRLAASLKVVSDDRVALLPVGALTQDLSRDGLSLRVGLDLVKHDLVKFDFPLPGSGRLTRAYAAVAWARNQGPETVVGLRFTGISEEAQDQIEAWVERSKEKGARGAR